MKAVVKRFLPGDVARAMTFVRDLESKEELYF